MIECEVEQCRQCQHFQRFQNCQQCQHCQYCPSPSASLVSFLIFFQLTSVKKCTGKITCQCQNHYAHKTFHKCNKSRPFLRRYDMNNWLLWAPAHCSHLSGFPRQDLVCLFFIQRETSFRNPLNSNHIITLQW